MGSGEPVRLRRGLEARGKKAWTDAATLSFTSWSTFSNEAMAGPGRVRSAGDRRRCGLRGGGQRDLRNLGCPQDPAALAGFLTACLFPPSVPSVRPSARLPAACSLSCSPSRLSPLTPEVTSQPIAGTPARLRTCSAQPRWTSALHAWGWVSVTPEPVRDSGAVKGRAAGWSLLRTETPRHSVNCLTLWPELACTKCPSAAATGVVLWRRPEEADRPDAEFRGLGCNSRFLLPWAKAQVLRLEPNRRQIPLH
jgi:hypothetical protein